MKKSQKIMIYIAFLLVIVLVFSVYRFVDIYTGQAKANDIKNQLQTEIGTRKEDNSTDFSSIIEKNSDFVGWIKIDGTNIDYPVVQNVTEPDYYMNHDFYKNKDSHGTVFADSSCKVGESDNTIIYGHNMLDDTMFSQLTKFTDSSFCEKNGTIKFSTVNREKKYQLVCVFKISSENTKHFAYHTIIDFKKCGTSANGYLKSASNYTIWKDNSSIDDNTKLLTLSTCEYSYNDGRLVLIAKEI